MLTHGDYVTVYCGKLSYMAGIFIRTEPGAYANQTLALVNTKYQHNLGGKKDLDNYEWFRIENLTKMSEEESSKHNWTIKPE